MAALSKDRPTPKRSGDTREPGVKAGVVIFAGALTALDANGYLVPFAAAADLVVVGASQDHYDNRSGTDGAIRARVDAGIHRFDNSTGADEIKLTDIGADCFGVDDQTVAKTNGGDTRSVAGKIFDVDASGVWVKFS
nr:hypothetical protein [Brucella anthropi]